MAVKVPFSAALRCFAKRPLLIKELWMAEWDREKLFLFGYNSSPTSKAK